MLTNGSTSLSRYVVPPWGAPLQSAVNGVSSLACTGPPPAAVAAVADANTRAPAIASTRRMSPLPQGVQPAHCQPPGV